MLLTAVVEKKGKYRSHHWTPRHVGFSIPYRVLTYSDAAATTVVTQPNPVPEPTPASSSHTAPLQQHNVTWKKSLFVTRAWTEASQRCLWSARVPQRLFSETTDGETAGTGGGSSRSQLPVDCVSEETDELYRIEVVQDSSSSSHANVASAAGSRDTSHNVSGIAGDVRNLFVLHVEGFELKADEMECLLSSTTTTTTPGAATLRLGSAHPPLASRKLQLCTLRFPNEGLFLKWAQLLELCVVEDHLHFVAKQEDETSKEKEKPTQQETSVASWLDDVDPLATESSVHPHRGKGIAESELLLRQQQYHLAGPAKGQESDNTTPVVVRKENLLPPRRVWVDEFMKTGRPPVPFDVRFQTADGMVRPAQVGGGPSTETTTEALLLASVPLHLQGTLHSLHSAVFYGIYRVSRVMWLPEYLASTTAPSPPVRTPTTTTTDVGNDTNTAPPSSTPRSDDSSSGVGKEEGEKILRYELLRYETIQLRWRQVLEPSSARRPGSASKGVLDEEEQRRVLSDHHATMTYLVVMDRCLILLRDDGRVLLTLPLTDLQELLFNTSAPQLSDGHSDPFVVLRMRQRRGGGIGGDENPSSIEHRSGPLLVQSPDIVLLFPRREAEQQPQQQALPGMPQRGGGYYADPTRRGSEGVLELVHILQCLQSFNESVRVTTLAAKAAEWERTQKAIASVPALQQRQRGMTATAKQITASGASDALPPPSSQAVAATSLPTHHRFSIVGINVYTSVEEYITENAPSLRWAVKNESPHAHENALLFGSADNDHLDDAKMMGHLTGGEDDVLESDAPDAVQRRVDQRDHASSSKQPVCREDPLQQRAVLLRQYLGHMHDPRVFRGLLTSRKSLLHTQKKHHPMSCSSTSATAASDKIMEKRKTGNEHAFRRVRATSDAAFPSTATSAPAPGSTKPPQRKDASASPAGASVDDDDNNRTAGGPHPSSSLPLSLRKEHTSSSNPPTANTDEKEVPSLQQPQHSPRLLVMSPLQSFRRSPPPPPPAAGGVGHVEIDLDDL